ncbi:MAG TPA: hypothetical protein VE127_02865, partial [Solirubrobacteraceae bacterium]|nr:hypothetical protein [Solirubrobacteraceae bacterium]
MRRRVRQQHRVRPHARVRRLRHRDIAYADAGTQRTQVLIPQSTGTTYYVSPSGSDSDSGTSPSRAWRTVKQVDRAALKPGDQVL